MGRLISTAMCFCIVGVASLTFLTAAAAQPKSNVDTFSLPPPSGLTNPKPLYATAYIVQGAEESTDLKDPLLLGPGRKSLGIRIPSRLWCLAADEGSLAVTLKNGSRRAYRYAGLGPVRVADCSSVFTKMKPKLRAALERSTFLLAPDDAPYGVGSILGFRLVPFRSIAIDRTARAPLALGQVVYIPKLRGVSIQLLDGTTIIHDGYVMAVDTGGAIKGSHVDFFEGPRPTDKLIHELTAPFDAFVVNDPQAIAYLTQLHRR